MSAIRALLRPTLFLPFVFAAAVLLERPLHADQTVKFTVGAGQHDRINTPIHVEFVVDSTLKDSIASLEDESGKCYVNQLTPPSLLASSPPANENQVARELTFILPELKARQTKEFTITIPRKMLATDMDGKPGMQFQWRDKPGEYDDLLFNSRPVLRYMYHPLDES